VNDVEIGLNPQSLLVRYNCLYRQ